MSLESNLTPVTTHVVEPNSTLYVKNIDWKIKKQLLRRALYSLFTRHGKVVDIITLRKDGLRGQAFVIMDDRNAAMAALNAEQGIPFFGKDMVIEYAHSKSDIIAKRDGDYIPKQQRVLQQQQQKKRKIISETNATTNGSSSNDDDDDDHVTESIIITTATASNNTQTDGTSTEDVFVDGGTPNLSRPIVVVPDISLIPTSILLAHSLPNECNEMMLHILFQQSNGYQPPVRMVTIDDTSNKDSNNTNTATDSTTGTSTTTTTTDLQEQQQPSSSLMGIISFDTNSNATIAYEALHQFQLSPLEKLQLTFGKMNE